MRAREAVMRRFRPLLDEHDISEQQWRVLRALDSAPTSWSVGELADATHLLGPSLSRMLVKLVRRGLIERTTDPDDSRRSTISIAPAGRELVGRIAPSSEEQYSVIESHLGAEEMETLYRLLDHLAELSTVGEEPI